MILPKDPIQPYVNILVDIETYKNRILDLEKRVKELEEKQEKMEKRNEKINDNYKRLNGGDVCLFNRP